MKVVFPTSLHPNTTTVTSDLQDKEPVGQGSRTGQYFGRGETHPLHADHHVLPLDRLPVHCQACITLPQHRSEALAS